MWLRMVAPWQALLHAGMLLKMAAPWQALLHAGMWLKMVAPWQALLHAGMWPDGTVSDYSFWVDCCSPSRTLSASLLNSSPPSLSSQPLTYKH